MLDLDRALTDIRAMRSQIARGTEFRGYGPLAFASTGVLAIMAALAQAAFIAEPRRAVLAYVGLWAMTAIVSAIVIGVDVVTRTRRVHSGLADEMVQAAAEQLLPALITGALITAILLRYAPTTVWMLPGLWQVMLSLGIFASCRSLPAPMIACAVWYLASGLGCLAFAQGDLAFSPWAMGLPFGIGQLLAAALIQTIGHGDDED